MRRSAASETTPTSCSVASSIAVGAELVAGAVQTFREGAPPRIDTPLKQMPKDAPAQPKIVGSSDEDNPSSTQLPASLRGTITVDGKPLDGVGLVELYPANGQYAKRTAKYRIVEQRNKTFFAALARGSAGLDRRVPELRRLLSQRVLEARRRNGSTSASTRTASRAR